MKREKVSKSYESRLKRELLPYLIKTKKVSKVNMFDKDKYFYRFEINVFKNSKVTQFFEARADRFTTWKRIELGIYEWETESPYLYNIYLENKETETHNDITDTLTYVIQSDNLCKEATINLKEYEAKFNENGEKQMKLDVIKKLVIKLNGNVYNLDMPINVDDAMGAVDSLLKEVLEIEAKITDLEITDTNTSKVEKALKKQLKELKSLIAEINDNIE